MDFEKIEKKGSRKPKFTPNIENLNDYKKDFDWENIFNEIPWLPGGGLNNAYVCIDSHVETGNGEKKGYDLAWKNDEKEEYTFNDLKNLTDKFASVLKNLGS